MTDPKSLLINFVTDKLKQECSCNVCKQFNAQLKFLENCGHTICQSCLLESRSLCPRCLKPINTNTEVTHAKYSSIFSHIESLCGIINNSTMEKKTIIPVYSPFIATYKIDHKGETQLHRDCRNGMLEQVNQLIKTNIDLNAQDHAGWTPLHEAVLSNHIGIVVSLLEHGALVNVPGGNYIVPLHTAVLQKNKELIRILIQYGANIMSISQQGLSPLDMCHGRLDIEEILCTAQINTCIYRAYPVPVPRLFFPYAPSGMVKGLQKVRPHVVLLNESDFRNGNVNYLVIDNIYAKLKYVQIAMLLGVSIVGHDWVRELIDRRIFMDPFQSLVNKPGFEIDKAVKNMFDKLPKLFHGFNFYFDNLQPQLIYHFNYTAHELKKLVLIGGGNVIIRLPTASLEIENNYPYHANTKVKEKMITHYRIVNYVENFVSNDPPYMKTRTALWLINCIHQFTILE